MEEFTYFTLTILNNNVDLEFHKKQISLSCSLKSNNVFDQLNEWEMYDIDMKNYSMNYPELVFLLTGYDGNLWCNYYNNGKVQRCRDVQILIDKFNKKKLK